MQAGVTWVDLVGLAISLVSGGAIIVGGLLAYRRFLKERPYYARADLSVEADVFILDEIDIFKITAGVKAIGKSKLELVTEAAGEDLPPSLVTVQPLTAEMIADAVLTRTKVRWPEALARSGVFLGQYLEAEESLSQVIVMAVKRPGDVLAYRVQFGIRARDGEGEGESDWISSKIVPVALTKPTTDIQTARG